jgi:uncharacterized protein (DUF433 family)
MSRLPVVSTSPDILGGTPVFRGTRVPVQTFIEYIEGGDSIDEFLQDFPSVTKSQVLEFLEGIKEKLLLNVA